MNKFTLDRFSPVIPIVPFYNKQQEIFFEEILKYIQNMYRVGIRNFMTTAGTTQFNLLSSEEVFSINSLLVKELPKDTSLILGIKDGNNNLVQKDIEQSLELIDRDNISLMLLYCDRYYGENHLFDYFVNFAEKYKKPFFVHGMFMRNALKGGMYNFSGGLINGLLSNDYISGIKEETDNITEAYKICEHLDFDDTKNIVLAGGSMRRFQMLNTAFSVGYDVRKNINFLSGVGSIVPQIELNFLSEFRGQNRVESEKIIREIENSFFEVTSKYGWHVSLRALLKLENYFVGNREPFYEITDQNDLRKLREIIEIIKMDQEKKE